MMEYLGFNQYDCNIEAETRISDDEDAIIIINNLSTEVMISFGLKYRFTSLNLLYLTLCRCTWIYNGCSSNGL